MARFKAIPEHGIVVDLHEKELYANSKGVCNLTLIGRSTFSSLARGKYQNKDKAALVRAMPLGTRLANVKGYWFNLEVINDILSSVNPKNIHPKQQLDHIRTSLSGAGLSNVFEVVRHGNDNQITRSKSRFGLVPSEDYVANFLHSDEDDPWSHGLEDKGPVNNGYDDDDSSSDDDLDDEVSTELGSQDSSDAVAAFSFESTSDSEGSAESSESSESSDKEESDVSLSSSMEDFQTPKRMVKRK